MKYLLFLTLLIFSMTSVAQNCEKAPKDAVLKIIGEPVETWAKVDCTQYGHIITYTPNYGFMAIEGRKPIVYPAQLVKGTPVKGKNNFYFTSISVKQLTGNASEFIHELHQKNIFYYLGQDIPSEKPKIWELTAITNNGKELGLYFYEYSDIIFGSSCWENCTPTKGFAVLKKPKEPIQGGQD